jgi:hypothetical protein
MARKGRFGRSAAGSQNLSALVYSLLKEERASQEDTMITAYRTNMTSGTAAGTFTSGGGTTAATATAVRQWYLDQAAAAQASGDTVGAARFRSRAEEFRVQSLSDMERVLDRAYEDGNAVDLALFGLSGTDKITASVYEEIMNGLANDSAMTASDKQRLQSKIYTVSYDYANEQMVNGFNEKKYTAAQLVSFYDKELKAALAAGLTETSKTYRAIQSARANAVARNESEIASNRVETVNNAMNDEADAMAKALQSLLKPVIANFSADKNTQEILKAAIAKGGGRQWLATFSQVADKERWDVENIYRSGAVALGLTKTQMDEILRTVSDTTRQLQQLQAQGYGKELGEWPGWLAATSEAATDGLFSASSASSVMRFSTQYGEVGGNIAFRGSGEPATTADLLNNLAMEIGGYSPNNVTESGKKDIITRFAKGDISGLFDNPTIKDLDSLIKAVQSVGTMAGSSEVDIASDFATFLHVLKSNPEDAFSLPIGQTFMLLGGDRELLQETITQVGGFGTFLTADVLRLALESKQIPELVKNTPGYVYVYDYDPTQTVAGRSVFTNRVELAANITKSNYTLTEDSKGNLYYAKVIRLADGNENIGYVAVPGGGNTVGDKNDLIIIKTNNSEGGYGAGGSVWGEKTSFKLTVDQLIEYGLWLRNSEGKAGNFSTPFINVDQGKATLSIGTALQEGLLNGQSIARWASTKGPDFYNSIKIVTVGGSIVLADKKLREYAREIFDDGIDSKNSRAAIQKWLQDNKGISDAVFNVTDSILASGLIANGDQGWTLRVKNDAGGFDVYFNSVDDTQDNLPPAPAGVDPNAVASTDPSFGIKPDQKPTPNMPAVMPTRPGAPGAVRPGAQGGMPVTQNFIPTSDLLEHTLRNIGPSIRPSGPTVSPEIAPGVRPPSGPQPTIGIGGERGSGPQARGISIAPTPPSGGPATIKRDIRFGRRAI